MRSTSTLVVGLGSTSDSLEEIGQLFTISYSSNLTCTRTQSYLLYRQSTLFIDASFFHFRLFPGTLKV